VIMFLVGACIAFVPLIIRFNNRIGMFIYTAVVGSIVGLAHGWVYSLASLFPSSKYTAMILVGSGLSTIVVAVLQLSFNVTEHYVEFYVPLAVVSLILGIGPAFILKKGIPVRLNRLTLDEPSGNSMKEEITQLIKNEDDFPLTRGQVLTMTLPQQISVFLNLWGVVGVNSILFWIPYPELPKAPLYIMWATSIAVFVGSELGSIFKLINRPILLMVWSILLFLAFVFIICYGLFRFWINNAFIITVCTIFSIANSYLLSSCYRLSNFKLPSLNHSTAQLFVNISLYVGVYFGMTTPYWLNPAAVILLGNNSTLI